MTYGQKLADIVGRLTQMKMVCFYGHSPPCILKRKKSGRWMFGYFFFFIVLPVKKKSENKAI